MFRILFFSIAFTTVVFSQQATVMGRIIDSNTTEPVQGATVEILASEFSIQTNNEGRFANSNMLTSLGEQILVVSKQGYRTKRIKITIQLDRAVNLDPILLEIDLSEAETQIGILSLSDQELQEEEGSVFTISGLLQSSKDVFLNAAAFDFSTTFFRPRGLDNANGKVLINGVEMNKLFSGRPQWGNWGGLNDAQRNREFSMATSPSAVSFGGLAGTTNIVMRASQYRKGGRVSYASANRSYEGRIMGSYNSGLLKSGWAYAVLASRRFGEQGYQDGTLYEANSFFASVEKKLNNAHSINLTGFYTPNRRGRGTAITQEMATLKGTRYNPNWGYLGANKRNSRIREIKEPVIMLNYYGDIGARTQLNLNVAYQFGTVGNTRIDTGGTRLININGEEAYLGGASNALGNYYQRLPSFFLQNENPTASEYRQAFLAQQEFIENGQIDWNELYEANTSNNDYGGNSVYVIQEDRTDDTQLTINGILDSRISEKITLNAGLGYRSLQSENYALLKDLLGGNGYLDVDFFAEGENNTVLTNVAQSDLRNRNRIAKQGERYKYNYILTANVLSGFAQTQLKLKHIDFYMATTAEQTTYARNGLYENGNYPEARSLGASEGLNFTNFGIKGGATYKLTGRHIIDLHAAYLSKAPTLRSSFSNARQNNDLTVGLQSVNFQSADISYLYRSPILKARLTAFYIQAKNKTDIGFYFTENLTGLGVNQSAFVQEVLTGIQTTNMGGELGVEAQITATFKLKAAASFAQYLYTNNPNLYLTSDDFEGLLTFGDGTATLKNYHVASGPERAYQLGFEYRDPEFWWVGATTNYFSNAYIDINNLARTANFSQDFDAQTFNNYNEDEARTLVLQEQFPAYFLVNVVGGKSWRIKNYYVGFFATVNNVLNQEYTTGGFEQGRLTNFRDIKEDAARTNGRIFGPRYFFGNGTTYYVNAYVRF